MKTLLLLLPLLLAGCGTDSSCRNPNFKVAGKVPINENFLSGTQFLRIPPGATDQDIVAIASTACDQKKCRLLMWDNNVFGASSYPVTKQQAEQQIALYFLNPGSNHESLFIRGEFVAMHSCSNLK